MPASGNAADRRDFDIPASQAAQDHFNAVASHLESLIAQRDRDVAMAMADYVADGASEEYAAKEQRWHNVAGEVRGIIQVLRGSLGSNDETATQALQRAKTAVDAIG
jgi:hypothetical protein